MADEDTAAERRLADHLELLRAAPPEPGTDMVRRVARTARWQRLARAPLQVAGLIVAGVATGISTLLGLRRGRP